MPMVLSRASFCVVPRWLLLLLLLFVTAAACWSAAAVVVASLLLPLTLVCWAAASDSAAAAEDTASAPCAAPADVEICVRRCREMRVWVCGCVVVTAAAAAKL